MSVKMIQVGKLHPHPGNPRLSVHEDIVDQIAAQLNGSMDEAHALIVRPNGDGFEIISGHHRKLAADRAGLTEIPCHIRKMSDEDAYMALALHNAQRELHPLEVGLHALRSGLSVREYAAKVSKNRETIRLMRVAAEVATHVASEVDPDRWRCLAEIHAAPNWLWQELVAGLIANGWTVDKTRAAIKPFSKLPDPPSWADHEAMATLLVTGEMRPGEFAKMEGRVQTAKKRLSASAYHPRAYVRLLDRMLVANKPARLSQVMTICDRLEGRQSAKLRSIEDAARQRERAVQLEQEAREKRAARLWRNVSLEEWRGLDKETQTELLTRSSETLFGFSISTSDTPTFNPQESSDIEWAMWSWNPITGCLHTCSYCYARDLALKKEYRTAYPYGFDPALRPASLAAPHASKVPAEAKNDVRYRNVFTGSMADWWGRWVPAEWIEAVLKEMTAASQWNFLTLTKFPARMAEFSYPDNVWLGTTVDLQARVAAAEKAFAKVNCGGRKWLSIEPMLEPLRFKRLDLFDFIVVGGSSAVSQPKPVPSWKPPFRWIYDLARQWEDAKGSLDGFYAKTNLLGSPCREGILSLGKDLKVTQEKAELPEAFKYLGRSES